MTQISSTPPHPASSTQRMDDFLPRLQRQLVNTWQRTVLRGDILALLIVTGLLAMPVMALAEADFADGLILILPITFIGIVLSFLLSRSRFYEIVALVVYAGYGSVVILGVTLLSLPDNPGLRGGINEMLIRFDRWLTTVNAGGAGDDNLIFVVFLAILYWFLTLNTLWHIFRINRVWLAILPPGIVLITTIVNALPPNHLDWYLAGYLFFSLILIIHSHLVEQEYHWYLNQTRYPRQLRQTVLRIGAAMALVVMLFSWVAPVSQDNDNWEKVEEFLGSDPLEKLSDLWNRLFPNLEGQGVATADYYGGDRLDLSGPVQLGDDPVMEVKVSEDLGKQRLYWRSTIFDTYNNGSWTHQRDIRVHKESSGMAFNTGDYDSRRTLTQTYDLQIPATSLVYAAPQPQEIGVPVESELNCVDGQNSNCVNEGREADVATIRSRDILRAGDTYTVVSSVSVATADELRVVNNQYPAWVTDDYLQGGNDINPQLRQLTEQIFSQYGATTDYDKAKAIEHWLRNNVAYNELIPPPPSGRDPVMWFIFEQREGYCNYFATAMVLMLRSEGIPARMAAGFAQGEYNPDTQTYLVIERDAHTWVEIYFPEYGWVDFEPTPDEEQLERPGDQQFNDFPTFTPIPSPTPTQFPTNTPPPAELTATPSITPTQTQTPEGTPPNEITATPSPSPSPTITPSPTVTNTPTPDPQQQETPITDVAADDDNKDWLNWLLMILGILLAIIAFVTLTGFFMIWWVEYRGLGGLTPVQKAYARMGIYGRWLGADLNSLLTPDEQRRRLVEEVPDGHEPIGTITGLYTEERFAPPSPDKALKHRATDIAKQSWTKARLEFLREKIRRWRGR